MVRVILICRDHLDNILFEAEVRTVEDEKRVHEECSRYADDVWVDFALEPDEVMGGERTRGEVIG